MIRSFYGILPLAVFSFFNRQEEGALALVPHGHGKSFADRDNHGSVVPNRRDFLSNVASTTTAAIATAGGIASGSAIAKAPARATPSLTIADAAMKPKTKLPPIGLGCWAWGDALFWGYNPSQDKDLNDVFDYVISQAQSSSPAGGSSKLPSSVLLDTAEVYGLGRSESLIGEFSKKFSKDTQEKVIVATKFAAVPFRTKPENVVKAAMGSLKRLDRPIDLYQIHFPNAFANEAYWDGLANAYEQGLVKNVGVSNYSVDALRACHAALAKRGVPLTSNQIQYSLLYRFPEQNGLLQACKDLDVQVLSYSPLALGLLTGKYQSESSLEQVAGPRKKLFKKTISNPEFQKLLSTMEKVASNHGKDANLAQVAINWCRAKGTIPIPGARNLRQVESNYAALSWDLSPKEIAMLDEAATFAYINPAASPFPRVDKDTGLVMFDS
jgi:pyridoxine 4-dehydrogenase